MPAPLLTRHNLSCNTLSILMLRTVLSLLLETISNFFISQIVTQKILQKVPQIVAIFVVICVFLHKKRPQLKGPYIIHLFLHKTDIVAPAHYIHQTCFQNILEFVYVFFCHYQSGYNKLVQAMYQPEKILCDQTQIA